MTAEPSLVCPKCQAGNPARILYGLPDFTPELQQELSSKRVVLGGCVIFDDSPAWQCTRCGHEWGELEWGRPQSESS